MVVRWCPWGLEGRLHRLVVAGQDLPHRAFLCPPVLTAADL